MKYLQVKEGKAERIGLDRSEACLRARALTPSVSQPRVMTEEALNAAGFFEIHDTPLPHGDVVTQGDPEQDADGIWRQTWHARDYTPEERAEHLSNARQSKIEEINDAYNEQTAPLVRDYPEREQQTWIAQEEQARAYLAWRAAGAQGEPPATPVLDNILLGRNGDNGTETLEELCHAVLENAAMFAEAQQLTGKRQRLVKLARAAETEEALEAITW